jgi:heptosyltransferase-2
MSERILVRCVNWLGDAVMTTPALQRLREAKPHANITLLTHEKLADLWQEQPYVDDVITFGENESVWRVARRIRGRNFDVGIAFPNSIRAALQLWRANIPQRVGYGGPGRTLLLNKVIPRRTDAVEMHKRSDAEIRAVADAPASARVPKSAHHIHNYLKIVAALGASAEPLPPSLYVSVKQTELVREKFGLEKNELLFGLNPGAEYGPAKRWPKERFAAAAAKLQTKCQARWVIFGGGADKELCDWIAGQIATLAPDKAPVNVAGKTTLRELTALLRTCKIVITNDTGPMHLANAVGTPVVVPFGSTSSELTGPIFGKSRILQSQVGCSPCFRRECPIDFRCMKGIDVSAVVDAADSLLK